jgi:ribosomal protein S18 acetylase RimI-like enzyme
MGELIRKAVQTDLVQIKSCAAAAYSMYIERIGKRPAPMVADFAASIEKQNLYVLQDAEQVCGFVVFYQRDDHFHLENLAVDPAFQRRGFGARLIGFVEQQVRAAGYGRIELYTNVKMTENLEVYPRLGYREFDRRHEQGFDRVYFEKII